MGPIFKSFVSGFGSGDYVSKSEATDVISDIEGRWVRYDLGGKAEEHLDSKEFRTEWN